MKTILVTGGAGYIGSVAVRELLSNDYNVIVMDNLLKGRKFAIERNRSFAVENNRIFGFEEGDLSDTNFLQEVFQVVVHQDTTQCSISAG